MFTWVKTIFLAGLLVVITTISACGNRGSLYLKQENENQQQSGHVLTQDVDETNQKKKASARKDKRE